MKSEKGMALVLTLMILVIITALVTEFSHGVFIGTSALYNWRDSQRLSFVARSGVTLALKTISDMKSELYRFPGKMEIPVENILEGFKGTVMVRVEDENARLNLNSLRDRNAIESFRILLENLKLNVGVADRIADWIDSNSELDHLTRDSEDGAKNDNLDSIDELLLIKGIDYETYEKLLPFVTVYSMDIEGRFKVESFTININTAPIPVIMSIDKDRKVTREIAERIVREREVSPFTSITNPFKGKTVVAPTNFHITVIAEENRIRRIIESVINIDRNGQAAIKYWKEM